MTTLTYYPGVAGPVMRPMSYAEGESPVTLLTVTPAVLTAGGASPTSLTALLAAGGLGSNTGILFQNSGREIVFVQTNATSGGTTVTSDIGTTVQGQTVPGIAPGSAQAASTIQMYGPYPSQYDRQDGTYDIEIDFGTPANVSGVVVVHLPGVA